MAEAFLADRLRQRGVDAHVHSAGLLEDDRPASDHGVSVLRGLGLDLTKHRSRRMQKEMLERADLVLGMAREHIREAVVIHPPVWPRAFTMKELVRRAQAAGTRGADEPFERWLARCHAGRTHSDLLGEYHADDVADPYGAPLVRYERTAKELQDLTDRLVDLAFPHAIGASA